MATDDTSKKKGLLGAIWETMAGGQACCAPGETCCGPANLVETNQDNAVKSLKVYDPAMCCSSGVCGPDVDEALVRFAADLKWIESQGVAVERFNLAQSPKAFVENPLIRSWLTGKGKAALPLVMVDGKVVTSGVYPTRDELAGFLGLKSEVE